MGVLGIELLRLTYVYQGCVRSRGLLVDTISARGGQEGINFDGTSIS
jgi:hypothetical protein